ncbi:MAG: PP2C family protein-serine/threonine phosphatase [Desertimonas sp.]
MEGAGLVHHHRNLHGHVGYHALRWSSASRRGRGRSRNEDAVLAVGGVFVVADGMGGLAHGSTASAIAVSYLGDLAGTDRPPSIDTVREACRATDDSIAREAARHGVPMGTTVVGLIIAERVGIVGPSVVHVGDARCYVRHGGVTRQVTADRVVGAEAAAADPAQVGRLTRYLGAGGGGEVDVCSITATSSRVLVCSDGLHRAASLSMIDRALGACDTPADVVEMLTRLLEDGEQPDDASWVVIDLVAGPSRAVPARR